MIFTTILHALRPRRVGKTRRALFTIRAHNNLQRPRIKNIRGAPPRKVLFYAAAATLLLRGSMGISDEIKIQKKKNRPETQGSTVQYTVLCVLGVLRAAAAAAYYYYILLYYGGQQR